MANKPTLDEMRLALTKRPKRMAEGGSDWKPHPENDLLQPIGSSKMVGEEKLIADDGAFKSGLSMFPSRNKSYRYVYHGEGDAPIGAMQIATQGPRSKKAVIQNLYVAEANRRQGIASKLLDRARKDFEVKHSNDLTTEGKAFAKNKKAKGGEVLPHHQREANKAKFLEPSKIKDVLYRGQRRSPKADKFITTQDRATPSFTTDPEVANVYSRQLGWDIEHGPGSTSVPVHMQTEKPFDMRKHGEHASLDEFIDQMDHDLTVPTHHKKLGYEDLADILYTLDNSVFKGGAKHVINARDSKGYKIRGFDKLGDEVMSAGKKKDIDRILHELLPDASVDAYALADNPDFVKNLKKQGYDSIIHKDVFDAGMPYYQGDKDKIEEGYDANHVIDAYRPLHQNKIKSAIGNRGTYDTTNPDITKAKGGKVNEMMSQFMPPPDNEPFDPIETAKRNLQGAWDIVKQVPSNVANLASNPIEYTKNLPKPSIEQMAMMLQPSTLVGKIGMPKPKTTMLPKSEYDANLANYMAESKAPKLYHGTNKDITEFDKNKLKRIGWGEGFHMAEDPSMASQYAGTGSGANVMPVHASIKNPLVLNSPHDWWDIIPGETNQTKTAWAKSQGYDGIKYPHSQPNQNETGMAWVAFEPTQIKSAIGNRGTYDTNVADINKAKGGNVIPKYPSIEEMLQKLQESGRTPIMPAPDRWFKKPEQHPFQQKAIEKLLAYTGHNREAFPHGAHINPVTGEPLDFEIMHDLGVAIDPMTGTPRMSGIKSGLTEIDPKLGSLTKSNLIRKGLFKHEGGDPLLDRIKFLATIEKSGKGHHYGLSTHYESPAELVQEMRGNPTLRPHSRGDIYGVGDEVGRISIKGMHHPVFEKLVVAPSGMNVQGKKLHKANGGKVTHAHHLEIEERPL